VSFTQECQIRFTFIHSSKAKSASVSSKSAVYFAKKVATEHLGVLKKPAE